MEILGNKQTDLHQLGMEVIEYCTERHPIPPRGRHIGDFNTTIAGRDLLTPR